MSSMVNVFQDFIVEKKKVLFNELVLGFGRRKSVLHLVLY